MNHNDQIIPKLHKLHIVIRKIKYHPKTEMRNIKTISVEIVAVTKEHSGKETQTKR